MSIATLEDLKKRGFWIYGLDERGAESYDKVEYATPDRARAWAGKAKGLHQLVRESLRCAGSHPHGGHDSVAECVGCGGYRAFRVETADGVG